MKDWKKPGNIILYHGKGFVSKGIQFFMKIYNKKHLKQPKRKKYYNHAAMIIEVWGRFYVAEALGKGITIQPLEIAYPEEKYKNMLVLSPKKVYSKQEAKDVSKIASAYAFEPTRYAFGDIWHHMRVILGGGYSKWHGKKGRKAEKRMHCTEACATWANKVRPGTFKQPYSTNPLQLELSKYYNANLIK